jgi:hypothetical protein
MAASSRNKSLSTDSLLRYFPPRGLQTALAHGEGIDFTAKEFVICEALTFLATDVQDSNFDEIPIHPILGKHKWQVPYPKHLAPYPLGLGRDGFWTVSLKKKGSL